MIKFLIIGSVVFVCLIICFSVIKFNLGKSVPSQEVIDRSKLLKPAKQVYYDSGSENTYNNDKKFGEGIATASYANLLDTTQKEVEKSFQSAIKEVRSNFENVQK